MKFALAALGLALLSPSPERLSVAYTKGQRLTRHLEMSLALEKREGSLRIDGVDMPATSLERWRMSSSIGLEVEAVDEILQADGARPTEFTRHYTKANRRSKSDMAMPGEQPSVEEKSVDGPLVDHTVAFTWDAESKDYSHACADESVKPDWLKLLDADMSFGVLLPTRPLSVGDKWSIDAKVIHKLLLPGGPGVFTPAQGPVADPLDFTKNGSMEARYEGKRVVEELELDVIHVSGHFTSDAAPGATRGISMRSEMSLDLEGEYLWDQSHGRLHSFAIHGPVTMTGSGTKVSESQGKHVQTELHVRMTGTFSGSGRVR